jgi:plasmid stabilization system protein ParE
MKILTGSHLVFYRKRQGGVMIVRILHRRMDFAPAITS